MKKYTWIVALLIALSVVFMGCPSGIPIPPEPEFEWVDVWELATDENIQALTVGDANLKFGTGSSGDQPIKPLIRAGEDDTHVTVKAVAGPEDQAVALEFTTVADWGSGIDLLSAEFAFQVEDEITITGEVLAIGTGGSKPQFQANGQIGGEYTLSTEDTESGKASTTAAGPFEWTIILDDEAIAKIKAGRGGVPEGPLPGIRLAGNGAGTKVRIDNIKIAGNRPTNIAALAAPVIELTETGVKWAAVTGAGGYKVLVGAATEEKPTATLGAAATSYNIKADKTVADGSHKVTVIATGEKGVSKDSPPSNEVTYVKDTSAELQPGPQADGSYVIDATSWVIWYGATKTGNAVSYTAGGASIPYPADFVITNYKSLKADYTCKIDSVSSDATKGGKGAKVTVKVLDSTKTLGQNSYYGTDVSYLGPWAIGAVGTEGEGVATLFDNTNSKWSQITGTDGDYGFAIVINDNDTLDGFTVTFNSIIFYP